MADLPLVIAFVILAAYTYTSGLRAPAVIAIVKDVLIYITVIAAVIVIPIQLGGYGKIFAAVPAAKLLLPAPQGSNSALYSAYATLALGSALALFLYPHAITGVLSSSSAQGDPPQRGAAAGLFVPARADRAARLHGASRPASTRPEFADASRSTAQFRRAGAVPHDVPVLVRRRRLRRDRDRRAGAGRDHVDRRGQSVHAQHLQGVHQPGLHPGAGIADGQGRLAGRQVRRAGVHHLPAAAIRDQSATARRHLDHPDPAGGDDRALHAVVPRPRLLLGWLAGIATGTWMFFTAAPAPGPVYALSAFGWTVPCYTAFSTLILNLVIAAVLTPVFRAIGAPGIDETRAEHYL